MARKRVLGFRFFVLIMTVLVVVVGGVFATTVITTSGISGSSFPVIPWNVLGPGSFLRWNPTGAAHTVKDPECERERIGALVRAPEKSVATTARAVQTWLDRCDNASPNPSYNQYQVLLDFFLINYDLTKNPRIKTVEYTLKDGRKLRGFYGRQNSPEPRPLVIARCGMGCDIDNGADKAMTFMHLMDEAGYHVLILNSASGKQFSVDNGEMFVSGAEEGAQMLEVIDILRGTHDWASISDVHLFGVSLGGPAALFGSRFAVKRPELKIRSAIAICPVVDIEAQLNTALADTLRGRFFESQFRDLLGQTSPNVAEITRFVPTVTQATRAQLRQIVLEGSFNTLSEGDSAFTRAGYVVPKTYRAFFDFLKFQNHMHEKGVPTLVIHSVDDVIVPSWVNSDYLGEGSDSVGVVRLERGNHCAFNQGIEWATYSEILRGFYQSHEKPRPRHGLEVSLADLKLPEVADGKLLAARWGFHGKEARLALELLTPAGSAQYPVSDEFLKEIGVKSTGPELTAMNGFEFVAKIARWLNTRGTLVTENGESAVGKQVFPKALKLEDRPEF